MEGIERYRISSIEPNLITNEAIFLISNKTYEPIKLKSNKKMYQTLRSPQIKNVE